MKTRYFIILRNLAYLMVGALIFGSCKSKKVIASSEVNTTISTKKIIQNHYANVLDFNTLSSRVKIDYTDGETNQGVTLSLRMKKNEAIWVSAPLGMFKAYITPERVSFYNKLDGEYFDGDFNFLSNLLGTEMDFEKVENMLIGNTVLDLRKEKYLSFNESDSYGLRPKVEKELFKIFFALEPKYFKAKVQQISQPDKDRFLKLEYTYQTVGEKVTPSIIRIEAISDESKRDILLDFKNTELDRTLNFPYKIPKGFKSIVAR